MVQGIRDINDDWEDAQENLNKRILAKAVECGVSKDAVNKYKFNEFNIKDMFGKDGTLCRACSKNLVCKKHPLEKKDILVGK